MSMPAPEPHEFVVGPDQAEDAQRLLGVPVHAGDRVRFEVIDGGSQPSSRHKGGRSAGLLAGTVPDEVIEDWARALDADRAERRAFYAGATAG